MKFLRGKVYLLLVMVVTMNAVPVFAQNRTIKAEPTYTEYYTIDEKNFDKATRDLMGWGFANDPIEMGPYQMIQAAKTVILNLLKWTLHNENRPHPEENYIRKLHFGRWINDPFDDTCMNTRAKVLVRESDNDVTFRNNRNCVVDTGKWWDPYSNNEFSSARDIQIDHMVPLKHAYMSGAWQWDYKTRCLYANYLGYKNHLVPASIRENTSKGDRAPDKYLPSNEGYRCRYVKDWLAIKLIWKLNMTQDEVRAIHEVVTNLNCKVSDFKFTHKELQQQRQYMQENIEYCMINRR